MIKFSIIRTYFLIFIRLTLYSIFLYYEFKIFYQLNDYEIVHSEKKKNNIKLQNSQDKDNIGDIIILIIYILVGLYYILVTATATFRWFILIYIECIILEMTLTRIFIRFKKLWCDCNSYHLNKVLIVLISIFGLFPFFYLGREYDFNDSNEGISIYVGIYRTIFILYALLSFIKEATRNIPFNVLLFIFIVLVLSVLVEYLFIRYEDCDDNDECCEFKFNTLVDQKEKVKVKEKDNDSSSSSSDEEEKNNESINQITKNKVIEDNNICV